MELEWLQDVAIQKKIAAKIQNQLKNATGTLIRNNVNARTYLNAHARDVAISTAVMN